MIEIEETQVCGWEAALRGMRNPLNSWKKADSGYLEHPYYSEDTGALYTYTIGPNDMFLAKRLANAGTDHRKYLRMITVSADITAPLYWWKEYDTYKVGTVANSCSTMHKIHSRAFDISDFSTDHLTYESREQLRSTIIFMNNCRRRYVEYKNKEDWWQLIQLLPSSYNQKRTVLLNYEVLMNIYHSRKNHKLDEWHEFCEWVERLPYFCEFAGIETAEE
jgi:hypothetical protein